MKTLFIVILISAASLAKPKNESLVITDIKESPNNNGYTIEIYEEAATDYPYTTERLTDAEMKELAEEFSASGDGKQVSYPCKCSNGICSCCTGNVLQNFNINMRQRLCSNFSFDPEEATIGIRVAFNDYVLYKNRVSARNPPPVCLPIPRLTSLRVCIRLNNVYFIGRNVHACVAFETMWNKESAFVMNFDCIRLGRDGIAIVKPEEGGGLPVPSPNPAVTPDDIEDYDENDVPTQKPFVGRK